MVSYASGYVNDFAYKQAAGEAATGDFAYAAKHAEVIHMGTYYL